MVSEAGGRSAAICFPRRRIAFVDTLGDRASPLQGQAFFYFGDRPDAFAERFADIGFVTVGGAVRPEQRTTRELLAQSGQNDWRTPRKFLEAARRVLGAIDVDPASGPEANETVQAAKFYTEADNGLQQPWKGRVWLNPPYGGEARLFVERLLREFQVGNVTAACLLVNSHPTETQWFQALLDHPICFVRGRIDFGGPSRAISSTSTHGSAIVYLGENEAKFVEVFSAFGRVLKTIREVTDEAAE